jgi:hypothetical protein
MRGLRSTIAAIVVLAGLGAYIYYVTWKLPEGGGSADAKKQEKVFAGLQADTIDEITVTTAAGDATTLKKPASGGAWQVTAPLTVKADEAEASGIASALASVEIVRVIEDKPKNLNDYGLSNPKAELDFKAAGDKTPRKLLLGDASPSGGNVFARRNDEPRVFTIPAFQEKTLNRTTFDLRDKTLLTFERDKTDGIQVDADGKTLALTKDAGGDWKISKPVQSRADFGSVEALVSKLQSAQMKSIVTADPKPDELKAWGFDKPEATVNLNVGSARATLIFGGKTKDGAIYARDASKPAVVTVESALLDDVKKGADDYRRKDLFEFRPYNITHLEITRNGQTIALDRVKGQGDNAPDKWHRVSPTAGDVAKEKMDDLLSKLSNMRAASFVESTAKTGLDKPALTVDAKFDDGKKTEKVTFGQSGSDVFALRPGEPGAAKADETDFTEVNKAIDEIAK